MDWVAYQWGRYGYGCSSPSTKVLHGYNPLPRGSMGGGDRKERVTSRDNFLILILKS